MCQVFIFILFYLFIIFGRGWARVPFWQLRICPLEPRTNSTVSTASSPPPSPATMSSPKEKKIKVRIVNYPPGSKYILHTNFSTLYELSTRPNLVCKVPTPWPTFEKILRDREAHLPTPRHAPALGKSCRD